MAQGQTKDGFLNRRRFRANAFEKLQARWNITKKVTNRHQGPGIHGLRYNAATLEVEYNGKHIGQVMRLTIEEAAEFFSPVPSIARTLTTPP
jgi:hypothetical protein